MKLLLVFLLFLAVASAAKPSGKGLKNKVQSAAATYCSTPSTSNRQQLQDHLRTYESLGNGDEHVPCYARGILDGSVQCQEEENDRKKSISSDGITIACSTTPLNVSFSSNSINCTFNIQIAIGIYYYYIYAYSSVSGFTTFYPANNYYFNATASETSITSLLTITLPEYAPNGTWTVYSYGYSVNYTQYYSNTGSFTVASGKNDHGPPVITSLTLPIVDTYSSTSASIPFSAVDDLSGIEEIYFYFYDLGQLNTLGYAYWYYSGSPVLSISATATGYLYNAPFNTYYVYAYVYDLVGFSGYITPDQLNATGVSNIIINAGNTCTAGKYLPFGTTGACIACPAGTYSNYGSFSCTPCPPGYKGNGKGAAACIACPAGSYSNGGGSGCTLCPVGKYSSSPATAVCYPCSAGTYANVTGSTTCYGCDAGYKSCGGTATCTACAAGSYSGSYSSYCYQCPAGSYSPAAGSTSCTKCPAGTYVAKVGATTCTSCPSGETSIQGSYSPLACA